MEVPVGVLYRWVRPAMPFHVFVVWYDCLVSSLSLFAIFFLARALWRSNTSGVLATVFYATLYPSYGRTVKNLFLREDFAIPLILLALFFTVRAMQVETDRRAVRSESPNGAPGREPPLGATSPSRGGRALPRFWPRWRGWRRWRVGI